MPTISSRGILSEAQEQTIKQVVKSWFVATLVLFFCFLTITFWELSASLKYLAVGLALLVQFVGLFCILIIKKRQVFQKGRQVQTVSALLIGLSATMIVVMMILLIRTS